MIGRRGKALILAYVAFLTVLFFMCSTDLIIREPETEIYQIAVIIEDVRDDNYVNFRKGMDQAAVEFNGDVHFITLYERMDANQQMELISREQQDGADALIIVPADEERVVSSLAQGQVWAPVVLLGSGLTGQGVAGTIALDYRGMGEKLASRMAEDLEEGCQVVILEEPGRKSVMSRLFLEGAKDMFDKEGILWRSVTPKRTDGGLEEAVLALGGPAGEPVAVLAESPELLTETAGILAEEPNLWGLGPGEDGAAGLPESPFRGLIRGLYGQGNTLGVLNDLDQGLITGICVWDQFAMGYRSVDLAVKALEGGGQDRRLELDSYYIEKEDLRRPEYEKLLYPIE